MKYGICQRTIYISVWNKLSSISHQIPPQCSTFFWNSIQGWSMIWDFPDSQDGLKFCDLCLDGPCPYVSKMFCFPNFGLPKRNMQRAQTKQLRSCLSSWPKSNSSKWNNTVYRWTDSFSTAKGAANWLINTNNVCISSSSAPILKKHVVPNAAFIFLLRESHSSWSKAKINTWHCFISPCSTGQIASMYLQTSSNNNSTLFCCRLGWNKACWQQCKSS